MTRILIYIFIINLIGFFIIWFDKKRAVSNQSRISENTLLAIVAFGGLIGSGLAMFIFRQNFKNDLFIEISWDNSGSSFSFNLEQ